MNIIAGLLILVASVYLGGALGGTFKNKVGFLNDAVAFIRFTDGEIGFYKTEIRFVLEKYVREYSGEFSNFLKKKYLSGDDFAPVQKNERFVAEFIDGLTELDRNSQKDYIALYAERAERLYKEAERDSAVKGKLAKSLIPLVGAVIFILVL